MEVVKIMAASFKRSHAHTAALSAPTLHQATTAPRLCQRLLDTHGQVWVSLLWGHCSFLLGSLVHRSLFVPSKSVPLVLCKFWWLSGSVNGDLLQEGLYHTRSATSRPPAPAAGN